MKILAIFNDEEVADEDLEKLETRKAVRVIAVDEGKIALLYSRKFQYHEIPGGGIEKGESQIDAVRRESKEEIGCDIEIIKSLGATIEVRKEEDVVNETHGYLVRVVGSKRDPNFLDHEKEDDFVIKWISFPEAIKLVKGNRTGENLYYDYITKRALIFLHAAHSFVENNTTEGDKQSDKRGDSTPERR